MKFTVSTYSFGEYMDPKKLGILGVMDVAKEMGFEGIELVESEYLKLPDMIDAIKEHSQRIGLPLVAFDVGADFTKRECTATEDEIERVKGLVDLAAELGVPYMRHDVSYGKFSESSSISFEKALSHMKKGCFEVAEYAKKLGVKTLFENHGLYIQEHSRVKKLLDEVAHENFGLLIDIGNFMCADDSPNLAVSELSKYAVHVHAKDFHYKSYEEFFPGEGWFKTANGNYLRGAVIGHGDANVYKSLTILRDSGYNGYVTIEFEGIEDNLKGIKLGLDNLIKMIEV